MLYLLNLLQPSLPLSLFPSLPSLPSPVLFLYAFSGSYFTVHIFGSPIITSNAAILRQEADLRYALLRVREHAEAIAFYRAGGSERQVVQSRLGTLLSSRTLLIWWQRNMTGFQLSYTSASPTHAERWRWRPGPTAAIAPTPRRGHSSSCGRCPR